MVVFPGSRRAHQRDGAPRGGLQRDIGENGTMGIVPEVDGREPDVPLHAPEGARLGNVGRLGRLVHDVEHPFGAGHRGLDLGILVGDLVHGPRELAGVADEGGDEPRGGQMADRQVASAGGDYREADVVDQVHVGPHVSGDDEGAGARVPQAEVVPVKGLQGIPLPPEGLDHASAADGLLDVAVEIPQALLLLAEGLPRRPSHRAGDQQACGEHHEAEQREHRAEGYHHRQRAHQRQRAGEDEREPLVQGDVDVLRVVGKPAHELAAGGAVEEADRAAQAGNGRARAAFLSPCPAPGWP